MVRQRSRTTRPQWAARLADWVRQGERVRWFHPGRPGCTASTVAGRWAAPHRPLGAAAESRRRLPTEIVARGAFLCDEWADDPTILWCADASDPDDAAVRFVDHFAIGGHAAALVATSDRLALVADRSIVGGIARGARGVGGLGPLVEVPLREVINAQRARLGRVVPREVFLRLQFTDGSVLHVRSRRAAREAAALVGGGVTGREPFTHELPEGSLTVRRPAPVTGREPSAHE